MSRPKSERPAPGRVLSHLGVMAIVSVVLGVVVSGLVIPFAGLVGFTASSTADSMDNLPQELETTALPQRTTILDRDGEVLATVFDANRENVRLQNISKIMVKALLAIEDYRFYEHGALDLKGTLRAFFTNAAQGGVVQGGSTITQQLVKQTLLQQADTEEEQAAVTDDTYARKLRELRYAIAMENRHDKDWILERYLNIVYFGDGAYGVQAAAQNYFSVNARRLNLNQAATLAGLVQNPTRFDPTNDRDLALERRDVVLDRMAELNVIPQKRADQVKKRNLGLKPQDTNNGCVNSPAPFFCQYVLAYLKTDKRLGRTQADRDRLIKAGGLTVHTTVDLRFQRAADEAVMNRVYKENEAIGALAMVEPRTGEVRALAQSRPMGADKEAGYTYLNYTVPRKYGNANGFQAGSTFKAFVLAAAIKQEIPLTRSFDSPQVLALPESSFETCDGPYQSSGVWDPKNSTGTGTFNLYTGTRQSVNTFYAQLERETGLCEPYQLAKQMGVLLTDPEREMVPSFTLGVADVSPLEMAEAYATFAGRGLHCDSRPVTLIEDANGEELVDYPAECTQVLASSVADAVNDVLRGVNENGGFADRSDVALYDRDDAGKTGTTNSGYAVWFVGYTPNMAAASMVAGADINGNWKSLDGVSLGPSGAFSVAGSTTAGPIWGAAMQAVAPYLEPESFVRPSSTDVAGLMIDVPSTAGLSVDDAVAAIEGAGFVAQVASPVPSGYDRGQVAYSYPDGGEQLSSGDTVVLYPSTGRERAPDRGRGRR